MTWTDGMEFDNGSGNTVFAEHMNNIIMAARGNYVISGLVVSPSSGLVVAVSDGLVHNNSVKTTLSSITPPDLTTEYGTLSSGESLFVYIYVTSAGAIAKVSGTIATTGQQLPPDIPENSVILAMIVLTFGDVTIDTADIENWQIIAPQSGYIVGGLDIAGHNLSSIGLKLAGSIVTSSAAELNLLDGKAIGIADTNLLRVDGTSILDDYAKFTANGLVGRSYAEVKQDLDLEIGTDILAQQAIGIADDNLVEIDSASVATGEFAKFTANGLQSKTAAEMRSDLGLVIGTNIQAFDDGLLSIAGLTTLADKMIYTTAHDAYAVTALTSLARSLLDDTTTLAMRTTIGLSVVENTKLSTWAGTNNITSVGALTVGVWQGDVIHKDYLSTGITSLGAVTVGSWTATDIAVIHGGTGSSTASGARTNLGAYGSGSNVSFGTITSTGNQTMAGGKYINFGGVGRILDATEFTFQTDAGVIFEAIGGVGDIGGNFRVDVGANDYILKGIPAGSGNTLQYVTGTGQLVYISSLRSTKKNIIPMDIDTSKIFDIELKQFDFIGSKTNNRDEFGAIADDVFEILPELVITNGKGEISGLKYEMISILLIEELRKSNNRILVLENKINHLS